MFEKNHFKYFQNTNILYNNIFQVSTLNANNLHTIIFFKHFNLILIIFKRLHE